MTKETKLTNQTLYQLIRKHGSLVCGYNTKEDYLTPIDKWKTDEELGKFRTRIKQVDFKQVGYYFVLDAVTHEVLILSSIGEQSGEGYGFNCRISRIRRRATKQTRLIRDNHPTLKIFFVAPDKIKYITEPNRKTNAFRTTKKTERNTILENAKTINGLYELKY